MIYLYWCASGWSSHPLELAISSVVEGEVTTLNINNKWVAVGIKCRLIIFTSIAIIDNGLQNENKIQTFFSQESYFIQINYELST